MTYPKPTIKGKPAPKYYVCHDMVVVYRADGSMLYKSNRTKHYIIIREHIKLEQADTVALDIMFRRIHSKQYPTDALVQVLTLDPKDRYTLAL